MIHNELKDGSTMKVLRFFSASFVAQYLLFSPLFADEPIVKESSYMNDLLRMMSSMVLLFIFIACALYIFKRLMKSRLNQINKSTSIKVLERRALHAKASLYLIEVLGKKVLISDAQGDINMITEIENPIPIEEEIAREEVSEPPKTNFGEFLKNKILKKKNLT